jgi:hypothetical protein
MGGKPRLAKLAKEQGVYEQFARRNKWPRLEDERKPTRGIPTSEDGDPMAVDIDPDRDHKWQRQSITPFMPSPEKIVMKGDGTWAVERQNRGPADPTPGGRGSPRPTRARLLTRNGAAANLVSSRT